MIVSPLEDPLEKIPSVVLSYDYPFHHHTSAFCSYPHFDQDPQAFAQMMKVKTPMMQVNLYVGKMISFALADPLEKIQMMLMLRLLFR